MGYCEGHIDGIRTLDHLPEGFDAAVDRTPGIDRFCSRSEWCLSWHEAFRPERRLRIFERDGSIVALAAEDYADDPSLGGFGRTLEPLECLWGYASPLIGRDPVGLLIDVLARHPDLGDTIMMCGLPIDEESIDRLADALAPRWSVRVPAQGRYVTRQSIELVDGVDGFLARRSRKMRKTLRQAARRAADLGIEIVRLRDLNGANVAATYARILDVEARSWKGIAGEGANRGDMAGFYRRMMERLVARDAFRVLFARHDGRDVAYLHGGTLGDVFRGFQFSFDDAYRHVSLGNLMQLRTIEWMCEEGMTLYDLGMESDYKRRWVDPGGLRTDCLFVINDEG